ERGVKGGGGVVYTAGIECLQGRAAASGVNQLDIQSLIGEKSGSAGGLVGCNAQQLAAKDQFDGFFRGGEAVAWYAGNSRCTGNGRHAFEYSPTAHATAGE